MCRMAPSTPRVLVPLLPALLLLLAASSMAEVSLCPPCPFPSLGCCRYLRLRNIMTDLLTPLLMFQA